MYNSVTYEDVTLTNQQIIDGYVNSNSSAAAKELEKIVKKAIRSNDLSRKIDAEEVISLTMVKLFYKFKEQALQSADALQAYVWRVANGTLISEWRRIRKFNSLSQDDGNDEEDPSYSAEPQNDETPLDSVIDDETRNLVHQALDIIGTKCSELLKLIFWEDLELKEIAERWQKPVNSIKVVSFRCRQKLREIIHDFQ